MKSKKRQSEGNALIKRFDVLIIAGLIILAFIFYFPKYIDKSDVSAHIYIGGEEYTSIALNDIAEEYSFALPCEPEMRIRAGNAYVFVESAACPDQICVECGKLTKNGDIAVCAPAGVIIMLKSNNSAGVDIIAY